MGGIVVLPEDLEHLGIGYNRGIKVDLQGLGVIAKVMVRGIGLCSSGIADTGPDHSRETPEPGVRTPESAQGKSGCLGMSRSPLIHGGNRTLGKSLGMEIKHC